MENIWEQMMSVILMDYYMQYAVETKQTITLWQQSKKPHCGFAILATHCCDPAATPKFELLLCKKKKKTTFHLLKLYFLIPLESLNTVEQTMAAHFLSCTFV